MVKINPWPWIAALLVLGGLYGFHVYSVQQSVKKAETVLIAKYEKKLYESAQKALEVEKTLKADADKLKEQKDEQIKDIDKRLAVALGELRKRPKRPTNHSVITETIYSCTGAELYREDGEFLAGEAARAERILTERDYYYRAYEDARSGLEKLSKERAGVLP